MQSISGPELPAVYMRTDASRSTGTVLSAPRPSGRWHMGCFCPGELSVAILKVLSQMESTLWLAEGAAQKGSIHTRSTEANQKGLCWPPTSSRSSRLYSWKLTGCLVNSYGQRSHIRPCSAALSWMLAPDGGLLVLAQQSFGSLLLFSSSTGLLVFPCQASLDFSAGDPSGVYLLYKHLQLSWMQFHCVLSLFLYTT